MPSLLLAAAVSSLFNLTCSLRVSTQPPTPGLDGTSEIYLRLDLNRKIYCWGRCEMTFPMVGVEDNWITLTDQTSPKGQDHLVVIINRETGIYTSTDTSPGQILKMEGPCEPSAFTGFPERKF